MRAQRGMRAHAPHDLAGVRREQGSCSCRDAAGTGAATTLPPCLGAGQKHAALAQLRAGARPLLLLHRAKHDPAPWDRSTSLETWLNATSCQRACLDDIAAGWEPGARPARRRKPSQLRAVGRRLREHAPVTDTCHGANRPHVHFTCILLSIWDACARAHMCMRLRVCKWKAPHNTC